MAKYSMKPGFRYVEIFYGDGVHYHPYVWMGPARDLAVRMRVPYGQDGAYCGYEPVLSGCLLDAPEQIISDLYNSVQYGADLGLQTARYISDPGFLEWARPMVMSRNNYSESERGKCRNILDSVERLIGQGLIGEKDIDGALFRWERGMKKDAFGRCSLTKIVSVSKRLDTEHVTDKFIDGVVYHQCLHLRQLNGCKSIRHDKEFRQLMAFYPDSGMSYCARSGDYRPIRDPFELRGVRPAHIIKPLEEYV